MYEYGIRYETENGKIKITAVSIIYGKPKSKIQALDTTGTAGNTRQLQVDEKRRNCEAVKQDDRFSTQRVQQVRLKTTPKIRYSEDTQKERQKKKITRRLGFYRFRSKDKKGASKREKTQRSKKQKIEPGNNVVNGLFKPKEKTTTNANPGHVKHDEGRSRRKNSFILSTRNITRTYRTPYFSVQREVQRIIIKGLAYVLLKRRITDLAVQLSGSYLLSASPIFIHQIHTTTWPD